MSRGQGAASVTHRSARARIAYCGAHFWCTAHFLRGREIVFFSWITPALCQQTCMDMLVVNHIPWQLPRPPHLFEMVRVWDVWGDGSALQLVVDLKLWISSPKVSITQSDRELADCFFSALFYAVAQGLLKLTRTQLERQGPTKVFAPFFVNKRYGGCYCEAKAWQQRVVTHRMTSQETLSKIKFCQAFFSYFLGCSNPQLRPCHPAGNRRAGKRRAELYISSSRRDTGTDCYV